MKKVIYLSIMFLMISLTISAQASGGQITRKKPNITSTTSTSKKTNSRAKTNTTRKPVSSGQTDRASGEVSANNGSVGEYTGMTQAQKDRIIQNFISNMVYVEGGTFEMGSLSGDNSERPTHMVTLSSFFIGKYEVTQEEWVAVMDDNPSISKGAKRPVENVRWEDCQEFIRNLNAITGRQFRLPTEAEWEYAACGGKQSKGYKFSGSGVADDVAWYSDNSGFESHDVGTKNPNELGLYDMCGNAWEWCQDWMGDYSSDSQTNPKGPSLGEYHVCRGGCWGSLEMNCRVSTRATLHTTGRVLGLRLAQ